MGSPHRYVGQRSVESSNMSLLLFCWLLTGVSVSTSISNEAFRYQLARAPIIIGVRRTDDMKDSVLHRNGKFIKNVFVPAESTVSIAVNEQKKGMGPVTRTLRRRARSKYSRDEAFSQQAPVYYLSEEPHTLHTDR